MYRLSPSVSFRFPNDREAEIALPSKRITIPVAVHRLLMQFTRPCSVQEVYGRTKTDASLDQFKEGMSRFIGLGVLQPARRQRARARRPSHSLVDVLNPKVFRNDAVTRSISEQLRSNGVCIIRNAFALGFARRVYDGLFACRDWKIHEEVKPFFAYRHHNLYNEDQFPESLRACKQILERAETKRFVQELAGVDCSGGLELGASLYLPGDHSLPHNDANASRSVAYIWHLTKDPWNPEWGGQFFWCQTSTAVVPSFNTLTLFNVNRDSNHFVCAVSPTASGRRFTVNGWWTHGGTAASRPSPAVPPDRSWVMGALRELAPEVYGIDPLPATHAPRIRRARRARRAGGRRDRRIPEQAR